MGNSNSILAIFTLFISSFVFMSVATVTYSAVGGNNVVINEVQIAGVNSTDEFVELYNPTASDVDLTGWRLVRYSSTGTLANLDSSLEGTIPAFGYYLLGHADYQGNVSLDEAYSTQQNIPSNGAVRLFSDNGITEVDTVGFGDSVVFETQSVDTPPANGSVSRTDGLDTDNNFEDFKVLESSDPQNSASSSAVVSPSPTSTASPSIEPSSTPTESPLPSEEPSLEPSASPTASPTEVPTPTPEPTATVEPTSTPVKSVFLANFGKRTCRLEYRLVRIGFMRLSFPRIVCS